MKHLFVVDPLERLSPRSDSSIALMREAAARGGSVHACEAGSLAVSGGIPSALAIPLALCPGDDWYRGGTAARAPLAGCDVVWMRKDPPFDVAFLHSTLLLSMTGAATLVVNDPQALRDANEKLFALRFPDLCPPSLVSRSVDDVLEFWEAQSRDIVIKPLDGCGGRGVFRIGTEDGNARALVEAATSAMSTVTNGANWVLAQRYIPEVQEGDKRIILVEGEPAGAVLRVPRPGELRANLHLGATPRRTELTARDLEICAAIGPSLREQGIVFAGIDVIGAHLTEVNVTSPTGLREIEALDGLRIETRILDAVESRRRT